MPSYASPRYALLLHLQTYHAGVVRKQQEQYYRSDIFETPYLCVLASFSENGHKAFDLMDSTAPDIESP